MLRIGAKRELLLRKKERGLSPALWKGFLFALLFHLALFFGIKIASPANPDAFLPLTPVAVEVDLGTPQPALLLPTHLTHSPIERVEPPQLLEMPPPQLILESPLYEKTLSEEAIFSEVEKIDYEFLEDLEEEEDDSC